MRSVAVEYPKFLVSDLLGSVIRFPLWWYGEGLVLLVGWMSGRLAFRWKSYGFVIWMQNLLVPMYGQYDLAGRLVSFVMRIVVLIGRLVGFLLEAIGYLLMLVIYASAPVLAALVFVFNLAASF
jgi:hypothetical protein